MNVTLLLLLLAVVTAADYTWNTASGGNFSDDANWDPSAPPSSNSTIDIDISMLGASNVIYVDRTAVTCKNLVAKDGTIAPAPDLSSIATFYLYGVFNVTGTFAFLEGEDAGFTVIVDDLHVTGSLTTDIKLNVDYLHLYDAASLEFLKTMSSIDHLRSYGSFGTIIARDSMYLDSLDLGSGTLMANYISLYNLTLSGTTVSFNQSRQSLFYINGRVSLTGTTFSAVPSSQIANYVTNLLQNIGNKPVTLSSLTAVNGAIGYDEYEMTKSTLKFYHDAECPTYRYLVPTGQPCNEDSVSSAYGLSICGAEDICLNVGGSWMCLPESEVPNAYCEDNSDCQKFNPITQLILLQNPGVRNVYTVKKKEYKCNKTLNLCYIESETTNFSAPAYNPCIGNINCRGPGALCVNGLCEPVPAGSPCFQSDDCEFGHYCNSTGLCAALLSLGDDCSSSDACRDPYLTLVGADTASHSFCGGNSSEPRCIAKWSLSEGDVCSGFYDCKPHLVCNISSPGDSKCYFTGNWACDTNADCDSWNYEYCLCPVGGGEKHCVNAFYSLDYGYPRLHDAVKAYHDGGCGNNVSCLIEKSQNDFYCEFQGYYKVYTQLWVQLAPGETYENLITDGLENALPCVSGVAFSGAPSVALLLLAVAGTLAVYLI